MSKKFFMITQANPGQTDKAPFHTTKEAAVDAAKLQAAANQKAGYTSEIYVMEAVAQAKVPVPNIDVVDIK